MTRPKIHGRDHWIGGSDPIRGLKIEDVDVGAAAGLIGASVRRTNNQSIAGGGGGTTVTWEAELWDTDGMATLGTNSDRLTVQTAGLYLISAAMSWASGEVQTNIRATSITVNGSAQDGAGQTYGATGAPSTNSGGVAQTTTILWPLEVGDYVGVVAAHLGGSPINLKGRLDMMRMADSP